jgi:hypothetical protein
MAAGEDSVPLGFVMPALRHKPAEQGAVILRLGHEPARAEVAHAIRPLVGADHLQRHDRDCTRAGAELGADGHAVERDFRHLLLLVF